MIWAIDNDDFVPECSNVRYPLLRAINAEFKAASSDVVDPDKDSGSTKAPEPEEPGSGQAPNTSGLSFNILFVLTSVIVAFSFSY